MKKVLLNGGTLGVKVPTLIEMLGGRNVAPNADGLHPCSVQYARDHAPDWYEE